MGTETLIPEEGVYVSQKNPSLRLIVTEVDVVEDDEDDDGTFFIVTVVRDGEENDMSAPGFEYEPDEWQQLVKTHQLKLKS